MVCPDVDAVQKLLTNNELRFVWYDTKWKCRMYCKWCGKGRTCQVTQAVNRDTCRCLANAKRLETVIDRYGVTNVTQLESTKEKTRITCIDRYGADNPRKNESVKEKSRKTNLLRRGVEYPTQSKEVMSKVMQTNMENLGVPWAMQSEDVKKKSRDSNMAALGVPYPTQAESVNEKRANTNIERYGNMCSLMNPEVKAKCDHTNISRYGFSNPIQNMDVLGKALLTATITRRDNGHRSIKERSLEAFIESLELHTTHYAAGNKEIDIFIPSLGIGVEFNGVYWHTEAKGRDRNYHSTKTNQALKEGICLIHIWEHLWDARNEQVKDFIRAKMGKCNNRIGMRKCEFKEIPANIASDFMGKYHVQGKPASIISAYGAVLDGDLLAVACFGKHHRGGNSVVLNRLCSAPDWVVSGFLGKAIRVASHRFKQDIISWVDLCMSTGKSYVSAGFSVDAILDPDYFYVNSRGKVIPKQSFRKIDDRTESQRAADEKMSRVWDCGKIRFRFKYIP
jgi:hypothetical protein